MTNEGPPTGITQEIIDAASDAISSTDKIQIARVLLLTFSVDDVLQHFDSDTVLEAQAVYVILEFGKNLPNTIKKEVEALVEKLRGLGWSDEKINNTLIHVLSQEQRMLIVEGQLYFAKDIPVNDEAGEWFGAAVRTAQRNKV